MARIRRSFRKRKMLIVATVLILFIAMDVTLAFYINGNSTAEMPAERRDFSSQIVSVDRSSKGFVYVLDGERITKLSWYGSYSYSTAGRPTSMEVGQESDALAFASADDMVSLIWSEGETPEWSRQMNGSAQVIALSEKGTQFGYNPDTVYILTKNQTAQALVGLNTLRYGREVLHWTFTANCTGVARSDNMHYFALSFDDRTVVVFSKDSAVPLGTIALAGDVSGMALTSSGSRLAILTSTSEGAEVTVHSTPSLVKVGSQELDSASARNLRLHGDQSAVYVQVGDDILEWNVEADSGFLPFRHLQGLSDYLFPSVSNDLFASAPGRIFGFVQGMEVAKWRSDVGEGSPMLLTDAGGWQVLGYDSQRLLSVDNTRELSGSKAMWTVFGVLVIVQVAVLILLMYWKRLRELNSRSVVAMAIGALAGIVVASVLFNAEFVDWIGDASIYLLVCGSVAAITCWMAWEAQAGLGGIILGTVLGLPLAMAMSLLAAFIVWAAGYDFPGGEEIFTTVALSLLIGFEMGLTGSLAGAVLARYYKQKS